MANVVPKTKAELEASGWEFSQESSQYNVYAWGGAITPDSEIGELIFPTLFVATANGRYDNCGGIFVGGPEIHLLIYENGAWRLENVDTFDAKTYTDSRTSSLIRLTSSVISEQILKTGSTYLCVPNVVRIENLRYSIPRAWFDTTESLDDSSFEGESIRILLTTGESPSIDLNGEVIGSTTRAVVSTSYAFESKTSYEIILIPIIRNLVDGAVESIELRAFITRFDTNEVSG